MGGWGQDEGGSKATPQPGHTLLPNNGLQGGRQARRAPAACGGGGGGLQPNGDGGRRRRGQPAGPRKGDIVVAARTLNHPNKLP